MEKLKVLELFSGLGACSKALTNLGIPHEIVDSVEIDKYAVKSFNAIHGTNFEPQDITKWDKDIECDLVMHGSPCQDFSVAGKQAGGDKGSGTRSSLMYETLRIVEKLRPKYVVWENVKNLVSKKHIHNYLAYIQSMAKLGYKSYGRVLNAKNYGIPQNRERVYTVSVLGDTDFKWPKSIPLETKLGDLLEEEVPEKYYLSQKCLDCFLSEGTGKYPRRERFLQNINRENKDVANSITTRAGGRPTDNFVVYDDYNSNVRKDQDTIGTLTTNCGSSAPRNGWKIIEKTQEDCVVDDMYKSRAPRVYDEAAPTLRSERTGLKVIKGARIRKLTPKECWRLMGFDDEDVEKAQKAGVSDAQLFKQAGNSIVVSVLEAIFKELFHDHLAR